MQNLTAITLIFQQSQTLGEFFKMPIRKHIKTRYNAFSKIANDVFNECILQWKSFIYKALTRLNALQILLMRRNDGSDRRR